MKKKNNTKRKIKKEPLTDLTTNKRRKTSHIFNAKVKPWTKEEDEELYKCHCLVAHTSARIRERRFNMWRMRNLNRRPELDKDTLNRRFLRISKDKNSKKENIPTINTPSGEEPISRYTEPSVVPQLSSTISRKKPLEESLSAITRTKCSDTKHKACVCVICDCFIIGVEPILWLTEIK